MTSTKQGETLASTDSALKRLFERCLLLTLVAVIVWALLDKARDMRSAAELGAFRSSLGTLRVALVLDLMRSAVVVVSADGPVSRNPFLLLAHQPVGYAGDVSLALAKAGAVAPGAWFFDGHCPCIGYRPRDDRRFLAEPGSSLLVFELSPPGVLRAREAYLWRGEVIN